MIKKHSKSLGGKGHPIYRPLGGRGDNNGSGSVGGGGGTKKYRYRLIIPDNSKKGSSEHDIVLTPTLSVSNDEQAKEEAALLGLLYLFPKLPHERTLPEPYRSTFLAALKNNESEGGGANGGNANDGKPASKGDTSNSSTNNKKGATANTQLSANLPSFQHRSNNNRNNNNPSSKSSSQQQQPILLTRAQINEAKAQHKREVQARIRKHEAIRNANKPVEVFMSARFKKRIECLLSGDVFEEDVDLDEGEEDEELVVFNDDDDVLQSYVHQRLVHEGFNARHVTKAYKEVMKKKDSSSSNGDNNGNDDQMMDKTYEEVLQYLCIHLKEHQLPIGFDPQLGQLDVVGGKKKKGKQPSDNGKDKKDESDSGGGGGGGYDANILQFAQFFGLTPREAFAIYSSDKAAFASSTTDSSDESTYKRVFWTVFANAASLPDDRICFTSKTTTISDEDRQMNEEAAANECEALEAIFEEGEFSILRDDTSTSITIALPFGHDTKLSLEVHYINGLYPSLLPRVLITSGSFDGKGNNTKYQFGGNLHLKVAQYMKDMNSGQEVIFELFGHVQSLLQEEEDSSSSPDNGISELLSCLKLDGDSRGSNGTSQSQPDTSDQTKKQQRQATTGQVQKKKHQSKPMRRPRERSTFWNTHPSKTPPAEAYPKLSPSLARARSNLPAAKAKGEFLSLLSDANKSGGRVMLVTGETVSSRLRA